MFGFEDARIGFEHRKVKPGSGSEAAEINRLLNGFRADESEICRHVEAKYRGSTNSELISVAKIVIKTIQDRHFEFPPEFAHLSRVVRRSRPLILKWFHDYWQIVEPVFADIDLADRTFRVIHSG